MNYKILLNNFNNPADNVTFTWIAPTLFPNNPLFTGGTARAVPSAANITDTFINTIGSLGTATYSVTPYVNGCAGTPVDVVINVGAQPVLDPGLNAFACSNTAIGLLLKEAAGSVIPSYYNVISVSLAAGITADPLNAVVPNATAAAGYLSGDKYLNTTSVNKTVTYRVQPVLAPDCFGAPVDVVITIRPQPVILPAQTKTVCSSVATGKEVVLVPANTPAGTTFSWGLPVMSDASVQGTTGTNVAADPLGTLHLNDVLHNYSSAPITAIYTITPTSSFGCVGTATPVVITVNQEPIPQPISGRDKICVNEKNVVYSVTAVGGSTFHWTVDPAVGIKTFDFNTNAILIDAAAVAGSGNITIYETNSLGCSGATSTLGVQVYAIPAAEDITGPPIVCQNSTQTYSVTNRVGSVYNWTIPGGAAITGDPSASSVQIVFGNVGGTILVRETNAAGCIRNHNPLAVTVNALPTATISNGGSICQGATRNLNVAFTGTGPYTFTYAIDGASQPPVATASNPYTLSATAPGVYTIVNVTDANCTNVGTGAAVVSFYPQPTGSMGGTTEICRSGSATLTMTFTGTAPFTFTYTDGTTPVTIAAHLTNVYTVSVSPLTTTTYTLTALTDGNTCTGVLAGSAVITVNLPPVPALTGTNLTCYNDNSGAITLAITDGTAPFGYAWTGPGGYTANTQNISGLSVGTYNVLVTDSKGCTGTANKVITQPTAIVATAAITSNYSGAHISCNGASDARITVTASGGTGALTYLLVEQPGNVTGQASGIFTGVGPGTYTVKVTDANLCNVTTLAVTITQPTAVAGTAVVTSNYNGSQISCNGASDGIITVTASGGTGALSYILNELPANVTGASSGVFTGLPPNTYTIRVTDLNNCFINTIAVIIAQPAAVTANASITSNYNGSEVSCNGSSDGIITATSAGGTGTRTYQLVELPANVTGATTGIFTGLPAGSYTVKATDLNGCSFTTPAMVIDNPAAVTATIAITSNYNGSRLSCFGASDGIVTVTAGGGTGALTYVLDQLPGNVTGAASGIFTGLPAGIYSVTVKDLNNCSKTTTSVTINNPPAVAASASVTSNYNGSQISCFGASDGRITVAASGGTGALTYLLVEIPGNVTGAATGIFTGIPSGTYTVRVTDLNACQAITLPVTISDPVAITATTTVTSNYNGSHLTCFGASDGRLTVAASGGTGTLKFVLNELPGNVSGLNTGIFTNIPAGTYTITVTDKNNCSYITPAVTVTPPTAVTATAAVTSSYNGSQVSCSGASDGIITVTASGGTGTLNYSIVELPANMTGMATGIFTGVGAGTYTVRVTDLNSCSVVTAPVTISNPAAITATGLVTSNYNGSHVTCNGASDGIITITAAGGTGALSYVLNQIPLNVTGAASGVFTGVPAGTYTVTVTDLNGCTKTTGNIAVSNPPAINASATVTSNYNGSQLSCNGSSDGILTVAASGGTGALAYLLVEMPANVTGAASGIFTGLPSGSYTVKVTDLNGCNVTTAPKTITDPTALTATTAITSNYNGSHVSCNGASDGRITVTAAGGTGTRTYFLNEIPGNITGSITGIFTGLPAGSYTVKVTDLNGCNITTVPVVLVNPTAVTASALITSNYNGSEVSCNGASDGIITVTASGGTGALAYQLQEQPGNTTGSVSGVFTGLHAGSYTVKVTDLNGCNVTTAAVVIDNPPALAAPIAITSNYNGARISCNGASDGVITVTATGGTGVLTYVLDQNPANITGAASGVFTGLPAGTYSVTVTDINGCTKTSLSVTLNDPSAVNATAAVSSNYNGSHVTCNGASDGRITVTASGGTGALSYLLVEIPGNVTGAASGVFTGIPAGTYTVRVRDLNLCQVITLPVSVIDPPVLTASAAVTSDYNGSQLSCNTATDGRLTVTASGGTGVLKYVLNELPANVSGLNTGVFVNVPAGTYTVNVTDKNSCLAVTAPVTITAPPAVTSVASVTSNYNGSQITCNGASDGIITATGGGGTGALTYSIVQMPGNVTGVASGVFTGVPAGTYTIRVTDVNNCSAISANVVITNPTAITATGSVTSNYNGSHLTCNGASDGIITITAAGGTGALSYLLNQIPLNVTGAASGVFTGIPAGTYTVTVTDLNGCNKTTTNITVNNPLAVNASAAVTSNYNGSQISCSGASDGRLTVTASGGTGVLSYLLVEIPGNVTGAASGIFTGLPAGTYTVTVTDVNLCSITTAPVTISNPPVLTATALVTSNYFGSQLSCNGASDGRITVTASGGTGALAYVLVELPGNVTGAVTGIFTGLPAGTYTVSVTDKNSCNTVTLPVTITPPPALTLAVNIISNYNGRNISCFGASDGRAEAVVTGGTGTYSYIWYSDAAMTIPIGQLTSVAINLTDGDYFVKVTDNNGCSITGSVILTQPTALNAGITTQTNILCYGNSTGSVTVDAVAGTGTAPYQYSINGGGTWQATGLFSSLTAATYTVMVRDANSCIKTVPVIITQPTQLTANITGITNVSCNGGNDGAVTITATAGSGTAPYTYSKDAGVTWQPAGTFGTLTAGSYSIIVRDANLCSLTIPVVITEPSVLQLTPSADVLLDCFGDTDGTGTFMAQGGTPGYTFTTIANTASATFAAAGFNSWAFFNAGVDIISGFGTVTVRVTDSKGCFKEATITFTQPPVLTPGSIGADQVLCSGDNPATLTQVTAPAGGPGAISYQWQYSNDIAGPFINIAGANLNQYTPPAGANNTLYYRRMVTSGICSPAYSNVVEIKVNARPIGILTGGETICPGATSVLKVNLPVGTGPFELDIQNYPGLTITGYVSDADISVSPLVTTTYKLLRVRDANGCEVISPSANLIGTATVTVRALPAITVPPSTKITCEFGMVTFNVTATGSDLTYQWYVNDGSGFNPVVDGGIYFGANTSSLMLFGTTRDMNGYIYHVVVTGCATTVTSADVLLTVNTVPEITNQPKDSTICSTQGATFNVTATGTALVYQWQVKKGALPFVNVVNDANFSGAATSTLTITNAPGTFNNYIFRVMISGTCGVPVYSNFVVLRVNVPPVSTLNPVSKPICETEDLFTLSPTDRE